MLEIVRDKEKWDKVIQKCALVDFYHTYSYHQLSKKRGEEPILICYKEGNQIIAIPLLLREIEGSIYKDATSVYGYPGPISSNITEDKHFFLFQKELHNFLKSQNIVSVFSRLNSLIPHQEHCLDRLGLLETPGRLVYIDLTKTLEEQWATYSRRLRTYINKSRSIYSIRQARTEADVDRFITLYHENMRRVNAYEHYFFDKKYFMDLMNSGDFATELLFAVNINSNEVAGGALFTKKDAFIQYHLSGTRERYLDLNPVKLLIDEMRIRGSSENFKYFNLGGGVGSKEDSLFYFKSGYSKFIVPFKVWKYKVNHTIYENLVKQLGKGQEHCENPLEYFPHYRRHK
ncbi:GNAT family N-acetyltransferase [Ulvibacterium sp.]|uniref:GNAT family N-acetyltransferase n=1 Tax=Ulvibacterium sp. TaxID=2665914 RepID=UPI003BA851B5